MKFVFTDPHVFPDPVIFYRMLIQLLSTQQLFIVITSVKIQKRQTHHKSSSVTVSLVWFVHSGSSMWRVWEVWEPFLTHWMLLEHTHLVFILSECAFISLLEFTHSLAVTLNYKAVIKTGANVCLSMSLFVFLVFWVKPITIHLFSPPFSVGIGSTVNCQCSWGVSFLALPVFLVQLAK